MNILKDLIKDAVNKDHTLLVYSEDINTPHYHGSEVDKIIETIQARDEINVLIRNGGGPDGTVGWLMVLPGLADHEQIANYSGAWIHEWHVSRGLV